jgi:hypothetical protein
MQNNAAETMRKSWSVGVIVGRFGLGSARASRAGGRALAIADFSQRTKKPKFVLARRQNQHARRVRSPDEELCAVTSTLLLHHENERADERRGKDKANALQRPDVIGHEGLADLTNGERLEVRCTDRDGLGF